MSHRITPRSGCSSGRLLLISLTALGAGAAALAMGGCYERVIQAKGIGASTVTTQEPYQESGQLDNWIFGDQPKTQSSR